MDIKALIQRARDSRWDLIGLAIAFLTSVAGLFIDPDARGNSDLVLVCVVFSISFTGLFVYQFMHLGVYRNFTRDHFDLVRERDTAKADLETVIQFHAKADEAFTELSRKQNDYEALLIGGLIARSRNLVVKTHAEKAFSKSLRPMLEDICAAAVNAVSARKLMDSSNFQSNIKIFTTDASGELRYEIAARSRKTTRDRLKTDLTDKPGYIVDNNGFFYTLRRKNNTRRFVVVDDIRKKLEEWQEDEGDATREPTQSACDFYNSCICVGIFGKDYTDKDIIRPNIKVNNSEILIGALFIDSKTALFDKSGDLSIVEELAVNAFSAVRANDFSTYLLNLGDYDQ